MPIIYVYKNKFKEVKHILIENEIHHEIGPFMNLPWRKDDTLNRISTIKIVIPDLNNYTLIRLLCDEYIFDYGHKEKYIG